MLFNTFVFLVFFVTVYFPFLLFGLLAKNYPRLRAIQNLWLLFASYFFYAWWEWFFLVLILSSTLLDYIVALYLPRISNLRKKKFLLGLSIFGNLGLLFTMKYFHFFAVSLAQAWTGLVVPFGGQPISDNSLEFLQAFILPVGISFYTFQTMSYTIDVYKGSIEPESNLIDFALFVNFFPQLVAGPIERAQDLIPQLKAIKVPNLSEVPLAIWEILFGYFMKVYVADNLGDFVDEYYLAAKQLYISNPDFINTLDGSQVFVSAYLIFFQIFCDFGGYSFIALGIARLLGVKLTLNFDTPEYSRNPIEMWNRWHITLNRWFRDYVYFPLGGGKQGKAKQLRNLMIVFLLSGLWHGANWTYITWGALNGFFTLVFVLVPNKENMDSRGLSIIKGFFYRWLMVTLVGITGVAFRCYDWNMLVVYFSKMLQFWKWDFFSPNGLKSAALVFGESFKILFPLLVIDGLSYFRKDRFWVFQFHWLVQGFVFVLLGYLILTRGIFGKEVIYFAF